ncbi:hypothetical protein vseg_000412 [Gypsophila vaccaria]
MDESWRMRMGPSTHRRRQSAESSAFEPEDFNDVFGGPPRSVLARKLSADFSTSSSSEWFYHEIFQESEAAVTVTMKEGQRLPGFRIPEQRPFKPRSSSMSLSKSKSTSSSVLSFDDEELAPPFRSPRMRAVDGEEDVALSSFTSRLRPINVPYRWSSTSTPKLPKSKNNKQDLPAFGCNNTAYIDNNPSTQIESTINNFVFGFPRPIPSPESINFDPNSVNMQLMVDYHLRPQSPSSTILSSFRHDNENQNMIDFSFEENVSYQQRVPNVDLYEDDMMSSSYIIEVNSHTTEANNSEAIDIDEAIAWAKEQFQG